MSPKDFLEQADLDSGGFGKVCLCLHRSHGAGDPEEGVHGPQAHRVSQGRGGQATCCARAVESGGTAFMRQTWVQGSALRLHVGWPYRTVH